MADVITRFKLETSSFDSKLRDTAKALQGIAHQAQFAGKDFNDFSQKSIEAARALGTVASGATNTKDKLKDLVGSYNDAAKAYNSLSDAAKKGEFGQALSASLQKLQRDIKKTKEELYGLGDASKVKGGGGGLFGEGGGFKDMLSVFGGNMLTKAAEFAANLGSEVVTVLNESSNLAREAEGVRIAFERLGRGDLLDGLRDATHGTVSDFELMKAAVKFDDFKLPLDELGTMLAFAQKKAKDTGQSVDYMVDSIVTGLGRKSLMILDNLGLSANEVKNKMKETGDMTKAVGEIIREQMAKAGEYVDTAADKSSRANAELQNQMIELGRLMQETFGYTGWSDFAAGIKTEVVGALNFTIETILRAKQTWNDFLQFMGIQDKPQKPKPTPPAPNGTYFETTDADGNLINAGRWMNGKQVVNTMGVTVTGNAPDPNKKKTTPTHRTTTKTQPTYVDGSIAAQAKLVSDLTKKWNEAGEDMRTGYLYQLIEAEKKLKEMKDEQAAIKEMKELGTVSGVSAQSITEQMFPTKSIKDLQGLKIELKLPKDKTEASFTKEVGAMAGGISQMVGGIEALGIELPEGLKSAVEGISSLITIVSGIATIVTAIEALTAADTIIPFARGGIVPHAANGYFVPGNNYSGDVTPIMANAGELVLNKAQQSTLASELQNGGNRIQVIGRLSGEQLFLCAENWAKRTGKGEFVTW